MHRDQRRLTATCWMLTGEAESRKRHASEVSELSNWRRVILFREEAWEEGLVPVGRQATDELPAAQAGLEVARGSEANGLQSKGLESCKHTA